MCYLHFEVISLLVNSGQLGGLYAPMALSVLMSVVIGAVFCGAATKRSTWKLGILAMLFQPAVYVFLWGIALCQDLLRTDGLPGKSMSVMGQIGIPWAVFLVMVVTGLIVIVSGRCVARIVHWLTSTPLFCSPSRKD